MTRKNFCTICFEKCEFIYLLFTLLKSALQKIVPTNDEEMMQNRCTRPLTIHLMSEISHLITHFQKSDFIQLIAHYQKWVHFTSPLNKYSFFWCYWTILWKDKYPQLHVKKWVIWDFISKLRVRWWIKRLSQWSEMHYYPSSVNSFQTVMFVQKLNSSTIAPI